MISLSENFRVVKQPLNLILEEKRNVAKAGDPEKLKWCLIGYYPDLIQLKHALVLKKINDVIGDFTKLDSVVKELFAAIKEG